MKVRLSAAFRFTVPPSSTKRELPDEAWLVPSPMRKVPPSVMDDPWPVTVTELLLDVD